MKEKDTYNEDLGNLNLPDSLRVTPFAVPDNFFDLQHQEIANQVKIDTIFNTAEANQYNVPQNYFENLEQSILAKISEAKLKDQIADSGFEVPNGYFQSLSDQISTKIVEEDFKGKITSTGFSTDENYFERLENQIFAKIAESNLKEQVTEDGFEVPAAYFEELEENTFASIQVDSLKETITEPGFTVPADYESKLTASIQARIAEEFTIKPTETPVVHLPKRKSWVAYGSAAAVALFVGIGSYFAINSADTTQATTFDNQVVNLDGISDEDIVDYLAQVSDGQDLLHLSSIIEEKSGEEIHIQSDLDEEDIEEYLNYML